MRVFITKNALSKGIIEAEVEPVTRAVVRHQDGGKVDTYYAGEWCTTAEAAIAAAEKMRDERIKSCQRTIEIMQGLRFQIGNTVTAAYKFNRNKAVIQYTIEEEPIEEFKSIIDAANKKGFSANGISRCCNGEVKKYKGFIWRFKDKANL